MAAKYELKRTDNGNYFLFNLKADNGEVIFTSPLYRSKDAACKGIESVRMYAADDECYLRKVSSRNEPYFTLLAANHQELGRSEMYSSSIGLERGIVTVKVNGPDASIVDCT